MKKKSILFYVLAVLFLGVAIYMGVSTFLSLAASASQYEVSLAEEWNVVLQNILAAAGGFLAFAFVFLGIGMILGGQTKELENTVTSNSVIDNKENELVNEAE